jgi:hypothetical protein
LSSISIPETARASLRNSELNTYASDAPGKDFKVKFLPQPTARFRLRQHTNTVNDCT